MANAIAFWILALISVIASVSMVATRNPVRSALFLVATFLCVALFYILLSAQFIAVVQIIVYAGAIMVLFLFVIMLLNLGAPQPIKERGGMQPIFAGALGTSFIVILIMSGSLVPIQTVTTDAKTIEALGTVRGVGINLFDPKQPWLFPFEITSILLLVAIIGAIIMAKRKI